MFGKFQLHRRSINCNVLVIMSSVLPTHLTAAFSAPQDAARPFTSGMHRVASRCIEIQATLTPSGPWLSHRCAKHSAVGVWMERSGFGIGKQASSYVGCLAVPRPFSQWPILLTEEP